MNYKKLITAAAATAMFVQTGLPTFAATELILSGNGSDSVQSIEFGQSTTTTVVQSNTTSVKNDIDVDTDTGSNEAKDNTGGEVYVETGDADAKVVVKNMLNSNAAEVENCGNCGGDTKVLIDGNGSGTDNYVGLKSTNAVGVFQTNEANVDNDVDLDLKTGDNEAEDNTGGDVVIVSGDVDAKVKLHTDANANSAYVAGSGEGGDVDLVISGNGSDSVNAIELGLARETLLSQSNLTDIDNDVDVDAKTGKNEAEDNTGGDVGIGTGDVDVKVMVDNMAGFNHAYIDDCCFDGVMGKIAGNGTDTDNYIGAVLDQNMDLFQDNSCGGKGYDFPFPAMMDMRHPFPWFGDDECFDNDVDVDAVTGHNENEDNTAEGNGDPMIITGDSDVEVGVENVGGMNTYGDYAPDMGSESNGGMSFDFEFSFSLEDLLSALGLS